MGRKAIVLSHTGIEFAEIFLSFLCMLSFVFLAISRYLPSKTASGSCSFHAHQQQGQNVDKTNVSLVREK